MLENLIHCWLQETLLPVAFAFALHKIPVKGTAELLSSLPLRQILRSSLLQNLMGEKRHRL